jgi:hypothetical protein
MVAPSHHRDPTAHDKGVVGLDDHDVMAVAAADSSGVAVVQASQRPPPVAHASIWLGARRAAGAGGSGFIGGVALAMKRQSLHAFSLPRAAFSVLVPRYPLRRQVMQ